mmetsp:Transcript_61497/g.114174  ORF Transcript_61497/g.114174 Transcript_61497/m.114174 type:complete len:241 (-) Transcript_61497:153-875(-)
MSPTLSMPRNIGALLTVLLAASMPVLTHADTNTDCRINAVAFTMQMVDVNTDAPDYASSMPILISDALNTTVNCVTIATSSASRASPMRRLSTTAFTSGVVGVAESMTQPQLQEALLSERFRTNVCAAFKTSENCTIAKVYSAELPTGTTTTTTEMPWGLAWWAWLLLCIACLGLCSCLVGALGAAGGGVGGKSTTRASHADEYDVEESGLPAQHVNYMVVDVPDAMGLAPPAGTYPGYY